MFSGIRSLIFGYSEPVNIAGVENNNSSSEQNEGSSLSNIDTSALLEQTLSAATTKLTEQLLPASPSIEQLQSSSRQLLPSLIEQHEEDETKKKLNEAQTQQDLEEVDDDGCFDADSWELLDLIEKPEVKVSDIHSTVQEEPSFAKSASGILKKSSNKKVNEDPAKATAQEVGRQKPKVSFETPDLVRANQAIEPNIPKLKVKGRKKNKKARLVGLNQKDVSLESSKTEYQKEDGKLIKSQLKNEAPTFKKSVSTQPVLNYAAALTMKLGKTEAVDEKRNENEVQVGINLGKHNGDQQATSSGAVKRNRPVSISSWSSGDELESADSIWNSIYVAHEKVETKESHGDSFEENKASDVDKAETESIISSSCSDCIDWEYGYHDLKDYIMRPKKVQNKKRGSLSNSSSLLSSISKRGLERNQTINSNKKICEKTSDSNCKNIDNNEGKRTTLKQIKLSKKKKMTYSTTLVDEEQLTTAATSETTNLTSSDSLPVEKNEPTSGNLLQKEVKLVEKNLADDAYSLMPPPSMQPPNMMATSSSGDDSSNIAEMEDSWFVTPPPCFTGSDKFTDPKHKTGKEAARENALIEHPSIYFASTCEKTEAALGDFELQADYEVCPAIIGITDELTSSSLSVQLIMPVEQESGELDENADQHQAADRNEEFAIPDLRRRNKSCGQKKVPTIVQPIEPERQPGWQLRKKRPRRRPLSVLAVNTCTASSGVQQTKSSNSNRSDQQQSSSSKGSGSSSGRSTPNLIDRIGSSIVANLNNLTNGFPNTGLSMPARSVVGGAEKLSQTVARKSSYESNMMKRRGMSRGSMDRNNDCSKVANSNRRADRRLKMHSIPNGISVDRKVHTSFH